MRRARKPAYRDEPEPTAEIVPLRRNYPEAAYKPGDRVRIKTGMQDYKVHWVQFVEATGRYLVHGRFGPCKFYLYEESLERC